MLRISSCFISLNIVNVYTQRQFRWVNKKLISLCTGILRSETLAENKALNDWVDNRVYTQCTVRTQVSLHLYLIQMLCTSERKKRIANWSPKRKQSHFLALYLLRLGPIARNEVLVWYMNTFANTPRGNPLRILDIMAKRSTTCKTERKNELQLSLSYLILSAIETE